MLEIKQASVGSKCLPRSLNITLFWESRVCLRGGGSRGGSALHLREQQWPSSKRPAGGSHLCSLHLLITACLCDVFLFHWCCGYIGCKSSFSIWLGVSHILFVGSAQTSIYLESTLSSVNNTNHTHKI